MDIRKKIHFIGIGGIGTSSLAQYYLAKGWKVTGSDLVSSEITDRLGKTGVEIFIGHRALNIIERIDRVIFSAAVKEDNPELEQARNLGIETIGYAQALGELTRQYITVAVAGAHGKSTTTALLSLMMIEAGLDPTVIIGTRLKEFGGSNFRLGKSRYLMIEADEYNKSFLNYYPTVAVITNVDKEHLDTFGDLDGVINCFAGYFNNIAGVGVLITNKEDLNSEQALKIWRASKKIKNKTGRVKVIQYGLSDPLFQNWPLKIPGKFNQLNCEAAWQAAYFLGVSREEAIRAIGRYLGSWRRMEEMLPRRKSAFLANQKFYSDYAHHPTEIKATIEAMKGIFPRKKLIVIFQVHQLERLNNLFDDFVGAFDQADKLVLLPAYQVAGRETTALKNVKDLFLAIKKASGIKGLFYLKNFGRAIKLIKQWANSVVVFMGAGDIDNEVRRYFKSQLL